MAQITLREIVDVTVFGDGGEDRCACTSVGIGRMDELGAYPPKTGFTSVVTDFKNPNEEYRGQAL